MSPGLPGAHGMANNIAAVQIDRLICSHYEAGDRIVSIGRSKVPNSSAH